MRKVLFCIIGAALLTNSSCKNKDEVYKQPNILFIMSDDHSWKAISAYGSEINKTPNIDRLAEEGILFQNCYVTNSLCAPSRAVILTGKFSHLNGVPDNHSTFDSAQITFPKLLKKNGYETAIVGKWHLKSTPSGFDYCQILPGQGVYFNPDFIFNGERIKYKGYSTNIITEKGLEWIQNRKQKDKPFLLVMQYKAPHAPWLTDVPYFNWNFEDTIPEPATFFADHKGKSTPVKNHDLTIAGKFEKMRLHLINPEEKYMNEEQKAAWEQAYKNDNDRFNNSNLSGDELTHWKYQRFIKEYLRTIHVIDLNIGKVRQFLKANNLDENTIVIYTSDQGYFLGEHGFYDKRLMYQAAFKTPLIIRWPNVIMPGRIDNHLVSNLDFAETLLDISGINIPAQMQGRSLYPILQGKTPKDWRKAVYYHYYEDYPPWGFPKHEGLYDGRYKLIHFYTTNEWEFYDLKKDPLEIQNLYNSDNYQSEVSSLKKELDILRKKYKVE